MTGPFIDRPRTAEDDDLALVSDERMSAAVARRRLPPFALVAERVRNCYCYEITKCDDETATAWRFFVFFFFAKRFSVWILFCADKSENGPLQPLRSFGVWDKRNRGAPLSDTWVTIDQYIYVILRVKIPSNF